MLWICIKGYQTLFSILKPWILNSHMTEKTRKIFKNIYCIIWIFWGGGFIFTIVGTGVIKKHSKYLGRETFIIRLPDQVKAAKQPPPPLLKHCVPVDGAIYMEG